MVVLNPRGVRLPPAVSQALVRVLVLQAPALLFAVAALGFAPEPMRVAKRLAFGVALALGMAGVRQAVEWLPKRARGVLPPVLAAALFAGAAWNAAHASWWSDYAEFARRTESVLVDPHLDPRLASRACAILREVNARSNGAWALGAYEGWRTAPRQAELLAEGRTRVAHSKHQDGRAIDLVFWVRGEGWSWAPELPWRLLGDAARSRGLTAGYHWRQFWDPPHVELPDAP